MSADALDLPAEYRRLEPPWIALWTWAPGLMGVLFCVVLSFSSTRRALDPLIDELARLGVPWPQALVVTTGVGVGLACLVVSLVMAVARQRRYGCGILHVDGVSQELSESRFYPFTEIAAARPRRHGVEFVLRGRGGLLNWAAPVFLPVPSDEIQRVLDYVDLQLVDAEPDVTHEFVPQLPPRARALFVLWSAGPVLLWMAYCLLQDPIRPGFWMAGHLIERSGWVYGHWWIGLPRRTRLRFLEQAIVVGSTRCDWSALSSYGAAPPYLALESAQLGRRLVWAGPQLPALLERIKQASDVPTERVPEWAQPRALRRRAWIAAGLHVLGGAGVVGLAVFG